MPTYPSINDRALDLWKKIACNLYEYAVAQGVADVNSPSVNDDEFSLKKKIAYYTAGLS